MKPTHFDLFLAYRCLLGRYIYIKAIQIGKIKLFYFHTPRNENDTFLKKNRNIFHNKDITENLQCI